KSFTIFYFQEEDGIRDRNVTGVQTCALPICMVNDLLQLSKFDANEYELTLERVEFYQYFHQVIDRFEMHHSEGITLVRHIPRGRSEERRVGKECRLAWRETVVWRTEYVRRTA